MPPLCRTCNTALRRHRAALCGQHAALLRRHAVTSEDILPHSEIVVPPSLQGYDAVVCSHRAALRTCDPAHRRCRAALCGQHATLLRSDATL